MRQFTDEDGARWELFEVSHEKLSVGRPDILPEAYRAGWLVFDNGFERRRLAPFPIEWEGFPPSALRMLLSAAEPVPSHRRWPQVRRDAAPVDRDDTGGQELGL
jgi:hypothetical protein